MNVLFATTVLPFGRSSGGEVASAAFIAAIREAGHQVAVLGYRRPGDHEPADPGAIEVSERPIESSGGGPRVGIWMAAALAAGRPYSVSKYRSRRYRRALERAVAERRPELVIVDHVQMAWVLEQLPAAIATALIAHNVEHHIYRSAGSRHRGPLGWINRREARLLEALEERMTTRFGRIWTLSAADREALSGGAPVRQFALPVSFVPEDSPVIRHDVGLLGTWSWEANAAGLRWFQQEVVPLLPGGTRVAVGGAGFKAGERRGPVHFLGRVDDAHRFLSSCRVVAVPAVAGGGVQVKILDAIASGRPVVATPTALRGLEQPPATVAVAEGAAAFAAKTAELVAAGADPSLQQSGRAWAERRRTEFAAAVEAELVLLAGGAAR